MTKEAVNRSVDVMGQPAAIDQAFALHQLCHAHNLQEFGMVVDPSGLHPVGRQGNRQQADSSKADHMDLTFSDEQRLLRESVDRFIAETYHADHRRTPRAIRSASARRSGNSSPISAGWRCRSPRPMAGSAPARSRSAS